jgi:hypothetical protein
MLKVTLHTAEPRLEYALFYLVKDCSNHALTYRREEELRFTVTTKDELSSVPAAPAGAATNVLAAYERALPKKDEVPDELLGEFLAKLATSGRQATPALAHTLEHGKDWRMRFLAVRALRPLKDPAGIGALIHALGDTLYAGVSIKPPGSVHDPRFAIREEAEAALREIGEPAHRALLATAKDRRHADQCQAVFALSRIEVPGRVRVLIGLARDRLLDKEVRSEAVKALTGKKEGAQEALVALLPENTLRKEAARALRYSKDGTAVPALMAYVREAGRDYGLAREAAGVIGFIDQGFVPADTRDAVDYLLFSRNLEKIEKLLGAKALPRLRYWAASGVLAMRDRAEDALASFE